MLNPDNLLTALVSGTIAGATASTITYPFDSIKTQQQLNDAPYMKKWHIPGNHPSTLAQLYKGGLALVMGSVFKTSARLITYNWACKFMMTDEGDGHGHGSHKVKANALRIVVAGGIAGFLETLWLIPFENIKITMIQNMLYRNELARCADAGIKYDILGFVADKHHKPHTNVFSKQYVSPNAYFTQEVLDQAKGRNPTRFELRQMLAVDDLKRGFNKRPSMTFVGTVREMYQLKGISPFTQGTFITMVRQVGILVVWFWTYNATRQLLDPSHKEDSDLWFGGNHTAAQLIGIHFLSSLAVIAATQPFDVIKLNMQLKNGKALYHDLLLTAYKLFMTQGPRSLFKGALPRWCKVLVSGGLTAGVYSKVLTLVELAGGQNPFSE